MVIQRLTALVFGTAGLGAALYLLAWWLAPAAVSSLDTGVMTDPWFTGVAGFLLGGFLVAWWRRETLFETSRRERQTEVYTFLVDALANVVHLPAPEELGEVPDEVVDVVADAHATFHAVERKLQLHGGRRVLRAYRALRQAHEQDTLTEELLTNLLVEMRRDLGLSVYSELRAEPLGFDLDVDEDSNAGWRSASTAADPSRETRTAGDEGSTDSSASNPIASSIRRT